MLRNKLGYLTSGQTPAHEQTLWLGGLLSGCQSQIVSASQYVTVF